MIVAGALRLPGSDHGVLRTAPFWIFYRRNIAPAASRPKGNPRVGNSGLTCQLGGQRRLLMAPPSQDYRWMWLPDYHETPEVHTAHQVGDTSF